MWQIIKEHFEKYVTPLDTKIFSFQPNLIYASSSISYTILGFPITAFCYEKQSKKGSSLNYTLTISKLSTGTVRETYDQKSFFKLLKCLHKQKYLFFIVSIDKLSIDNFNSNLVAANVKLKCKYHLLEEDALTLSGAKLDSSKKTMPKYLYGVSKKGKLKLLYKANKKICGAKEYWKPKGD